MMHLQRKKKNEENADLTMVIFTFHIYVPESYKAKLTKITKYAFLISKSITKV